MNAPEERAAKLRDLINEYRYNYHVLNKSIMSEAAADSLKHELSLIETQHPDLITPDSPTQRVAGQPLPRFKQISHSSRMLSLNDVFNEEELESWIKRITKLIAGKTQPDYFIDLKMDGLAAAIIYKDGVLIQAVTRGDGFVGEDVTANVRTIESVPLSLRHSKKYRSFFEGRTEIRGEIIMYRQAFEKLNRERAKEGLRLFANPRNLAAGTVRQLDPKLVAARPLQFHAYDLLRDQPKDVPTNDFAYEVLRELGFIANPQAQRAKTAKEIMKYARKWADKRSDLPFDTDGLVVKVNDRQLFRQLGIVGKAPRGAVAYKYPAQQATTKVKDIFVSIGRTGAATPVALLQPVGVAGSTVQMATLHNEGEVQRKDIRIGDTVIVHKAGDVIPEVVKPLAKLRDGSEKKFKMPAVCPQCGTRLVKAKETEAVWRCPNDSCPSRIWKRIQHFASKPALDIEGLGEKNVMALINARLISDAADIFTLKIEDIVKLDRFAELSASKLTKAIRSKKNPPLPRFVYGLGIRQVGIQTAIDLAENFTSISDLSKATIDELGMVEGIGKVVAESIVEWFSQPANQKLLQKFEKNGVRPKKAEKSHGRLDGVSFAVTGSLKTMSREETAIKIRSQGGNFQSSVGKSTDFLVAGENTGENKLETARKLGTKVIKEADLLKMLDKA